MKQVQVGNLMNRSVVTATSDASLAEIVATMRQNKVSCVVVVAAGGKPVGIITERDLVRLLGDILHDRDSARTVAGDFMTSSPVVIEQTTPLFDALVITQSRQIRHLPVIDAKGNLCGILSYTDLAHAYEHIIEQQREIIEQELNFEAARLREVNEQLKALSMEDALLAIGNRRSMEVDLCYTHNMALRYKRAYSIVLFDIDCFKQYNDHYGHQAGDEALKLVANHIRCAIRKADRLYRYGGEELLLLLPETPADGADITARRIVADLAERNVPHAKSPFGILTMSGGVAAIDPDQVSDPNWRLPVEEADRRLYEAKLAGRNRISEAAQTPATAASPAVGQT